MGAGFLQDLNNASATQNATQAQSNIMPTYQGNGYKTTQGNEFNYTTPKAPFWGTYTAPININPPQAETTPTKSTSSNPFSSLAGPAGGPVYYDATRGEYYTQSYSPLSVFSAPGSSINGRTYIGTSPTGSKTSSSSSFDNPSPLPNYSMYIPPSQMPDVNAYLGDPNSLLSSFRNAGVPISGAGRFSNLLSTTNSSKGK